MPPEHPSPGSPEDWLRHAQADLRFAILPAGDDEDLQGLRLFHLQQAVEKSLKGVLVRSGVIFRPTHDIAELITVLKQQGVEWPNDLDGARGLTVFAVRARYPGSARILGAVQFQAAIDLTRLTIAWAEEQIAGGR